MYELFATIKHTGNSDGISSACYVDGEVIGGVIFCAWPERTSVTSSIGPNEAIRQCAFVHRYSTVLNRHKAHTSDEINSCA